MARQVGAPTVVAGSHAAAYVYGYWRAADLDGYHWYYGDGLSAGVIPTNDGLAGVFAAGPAGGETRRAAAPHPPARYCPRPPGTAQLPAHRPHPGPAAGPGPIFRGLPARLRRPSGPGWALVGDAGAWKDPLSTYGITDAFRHASCWPGPLSRVLGRTTRCGPPSAAIKPNATAGRCQWDRVIVDRLASHQWDLTQVQQLLRELSSVMADDVEDIKAFDGVSAPTA